MTERDYILATNLARILGAKDLLGEMSASDIVPEQEWVSVFATLQRWRDATFEAIRKRRDETDDAAAAKPIARPRTCTEGGLCLCDCHDEAKKEPTP